MAGIRPYRWLYRARQFFTALLGRVSEQDMEEARQVLGPGLYAVFAALPGQYRLHALQVYRRARGAGCDDPQVWQAALLHDAGKYDPDSGRYVTLPHRVAVVLLKALPGGRYLLERLAGWSNPAGVGGRLFYPFYLSRHHARLGAELAHRHGASGAVVRLIADHHRPAQARVNPRLQMLRAADESS